MALYLVVEHSHRRQLITAARFPPPHPPPPASLSRSRLRASEKQQQLYSSSSISLSKGHPLVRRQLATPGNSGAARSLAIQVSRSACLPTHRVTAGRSMYNASPDKSRSNGSSSTQRTAPLRCIGLLGSRPAVVSLLFLTDAVFDQLQEQNSCPRVCWTSGRERLSRLLVCLATWSICANLAEVVAVVIAHVEVVRSISKPM